MNTEKLLIDLLLSELAGIANKKEKYMKLIPDPRVLIMGLRDTGYDTNTALADVVDNSVDAEASLIEVNIRLDVRNNPSVMIADNGCGMDKAALIDGMKYGSSDTSTKDPKRLGKFGLGLKTASTAFCRRFSVLSRANVADPIYMATWDLDNVVTKGEWEMDIIEESLIPKPYLAVLKNIMGNAGHGTLVVWEKVDRFASGKPTQKNIDKIASNFSQYASMIYHRFLDKNDSRARNLTMKINGKELEPWDPFCLSEMRDDDTGTIRIAGPVNKDCDVILENGETEKAAFLLEAYVLPDKDSFSSEEAKKKANIKNNNMGFYVYRENRMIASGDWLGLRSSEPHDSLYRAEFSFNHRLDAAFKIDVKKSKITLNPDLADWLSTWIKPGLRCAEDRYRNRTNQSVSKNASDYHIEPDKNIQQSEKYVTDSKIELVGDIRSDGTQNVKVRNSNNLEEPAVISIKIAPDDKPGVTIILDDVRGGALWEPSYRDGHHCVIINPNHPFYQKVYYPNKKSGVTMIGLDSLLWAFVEAEYGTINEYQKRDFEDFRMKISRILLELVKSLPEPDID